MFTLGASALLFGTLSGFRHAFEPDHLTAVSTLVTTGRGPWRAARLGAWWGLGHTTSLALVGVILAALHTTLPSALEQGFEFAVAVMLLVLGLRGVTSALLPSYEDGWLSRVSWFKVHDHSGLAPHVHLGQRSFALRPLTIGLIHGLAGSGALAALAMSSLPTVGLRFAYTLLFGLASTAGMAMVSGLAGLSLSRLTQSDRALVLMSLTTGLLSIVVAVLWGWPIVQEWVA